MQEVLSSQQLSEFVSLHKLRNRYSIVYFKALVTIETAMNLLTNVQMNIRISFSDYESAGKVTIEDDLNPYLYPTIFEAKWQIIEHVNSEFLYITDVHKKNKNIGKYSVKITPLNIINQ